MGRGGGGRRVFWRRIDETRSKQLGGSEEKLSARAEVLTAIIWASGTAAFIVRAGESILRKKKPHRDGASRFSNAIALGWARVPERFLLKTVVDPALNWLSSSPCSD